MASAYFLAVNAVSALPSSVPIEVNSPAMCALWACLFSASTKLFTTLSSLSYASSSADLGGVCSCTGAGFDGEGDFSAGAAGGLVAQR